MNRPILTVPVQKVEGDSSAPFQDLLAVEEPLEIRLGDKSISITMRTPGHDFELAAGFLFTEGILHDATEIREIRWSHQTNGNPRQVGNSVTVDLNPGVEVDLDRLERHFYTSSSCGVCGKASIEAIQMQGCPVLPRNARWSRAASIHLLARSSAARPARLRAHRRACTRRRCSHRRERSSSCAKTSAATTRSTN